MSANLATESLVSAYLWLSVVVWTIAVTQAVRFRDGAFILTMRAVFAVAAAACLAGRAAA